MAHRSRTGACQPLAARVGQRVHLRLVDGQLLDGTLTRMDDRTLRLRLTGRGRLVVVYQRAAAALYVAPPLAA